MLMMAGCAAPQQASVPNTSDSTLPVVQDVPEFPEEDAIRTLRTAFRVITTRYIDEIPIDQLALEGIRGIGTLDPELSIEQMDGALMVKYDDKDIAEVILPATDDVTDWAEATVDVIDTVRTVSEDAAHADAERVYEAILDSTLSDLDIFSRYAGKEEASKNKAKRDGYGGIGLRLHTVNDFVTIREVFRHSPAYEIGLLKGDRLLRVNDEIVTDMAPKAVARLIRGKIDSPVKVAVQRAGRAFPVVFEMQRRHVVPETVMSRYRNGILTVRVTSFNSATVNHLAEAIEQVRDDGPDDLKGVILDLRGNPGGLLKQAVGVADIFLGGGSIISAKGRHPGSYQSYESSQPDILRDRPLVVLVNGRSASSAEIVAATLQDRGRAVVVGSSSYGKGTVQTVVPLPNGGELTLTWSRLIAPSGYAFHGLGIRPTICTSGKTSTDAAELVHEAQTTTMLKAALVEWRTAPLDDVELRRKLRQACPSDKQHRAIDLTVARRLLQNDLAYQHALEASSVASLEN